MFVKIVSNLILVICFSACVNNSDEQVIKTLENRFDSTEKSPGISIKNGPRQGFQYVDANEAEYNYRYYTITLTNDSIIPIQLEVNFNEKISGLTDSLKSSIFLLPRYLTPAIQHFDESMSLELKKFLDKVQDTTVNLSKTLKPSEYCTLTFGVLTNLKYFDPTTPYGTQLLTSEKNSSTQTLKLKINEDLVIPCGELVYINN